MSGPAFTPGRELSGAFYREAVRPLLAGRPHGAALLGWGSDVLGFDTPRSTDHGWGPRLQVFVAPEAAADVERLVAAGLPDAFHGWPVRFGWDAAPVDHHVTVADLPRWSRDALGVDVTRPLGTADWLGTPQQLLLGVVAGPVHADDTGELADARRRLAWYPDQVWRWMLACQWRRLAQEEAFVHRTAEVGDELGSAVVAGRLARDVMRLALLLERRYAPYGKWLGSAFARLDQSDGLAEHLAAVVTADDLDGREAALSAAYSRIAERHNRTGLTEPLDPSLRPYHARPAQVLMADRFADACLATVTDPALRALPVVGAIDQCVDSTDALADPAVLRRFRAVWRA